MNDQHQEPDAPLVGTLWFVLVLGAGIVIGWFWLFSVLKERW